MAAKDSGERRKTDAEKLSLHGLSPEDALKKALSTPPPKRDGKKPAQSRKPGKK